MARGIRGRAAREAARDAASAKLQVLAKKKNEDGSDMFLVGTSQEDAVEMTADEVAQQLQSGAIPLISGEGTFADAKQAADYNTRALTEWSDIVPMKPDQYMALANRYGISADPRIQDQYSSLKQQDILKPTTSAAPTPEYSPSGILGQATAKQAPTPSPLTGELSSLAPSPMMPGAEKDISPIPMGAQFGLAPGLGIGMTAKPMRQNANQFAEQILKRRRDLSVPVGPTAAASSAQLPEDMQTLPSTIETPSKYAGETLSAVQARRDELAKDPVFATSDFGKAALARMDAQLKPGNEATAPLTESEKSSMKTLIPKTQYDQWLALGEVDPDKARQAGMKFFKDPGASLADEMMKIMAITTAKKDIDEKYKAQEREQKRAEAFKGSRRALNSMMAAADIVLEGDIGPAAGRWRNFQAAIGNDDVVKLYEDYRKGLAGSLKMLAGETGRLTDADIERIVALVPSVTDTEATFRTKMEMMEAMTDPNLDEEQWAEKSKEITERLIRSGGDKNKGTPKTPLRFNEETGALE